MKILSIETSCDETAVSIIEATGDAKSPSFKILGNGLYSQIEKHVEFGGVMPTLAKREHAKNLVPLLKKASDDAFDNAENFSLKFAPANISLDDEIKKDAEKILSREDGLYEDLINFLEKNELIDIDCIAVTEGPGLEPALWVGVSFAKALAVILNKPLVAVNHMEGHIVSVLMGSGTASDSEVDRSANVNFPALALLISGGHTELVHIKNWHEYKIVGQTQDDAVGEAFDKVARMLDLQYPGGPKVSKLAGKWREQTKDGVTSEENSLAQDDDAEKVEIAEKSVKNIWTLPRPMIHSKDYNFSFSGLKTAVLYALKKKVEADGPISEQEKEMLCAEFEDAVTEVLVKKTKQALTDLKAKTLIIGGGVIANTFIKSAMEKMVTELNTETQASVKMYAPSIDMSTDNSVMIGIAGYLRYLAGFVENNPRELTAKGGLSL